MRVVLLNESPGADDHAHAFTRAARSFNQGLDIRLRFLDVGFEVRHLPVRGEDDGVATRVTKAIETFQPSVILALGDGPRLLECAAVSAKAGCPLAYVLNGDATRPARAIACLAGVLAVTGDVEPALAGSDTRVHTIEEGRPIGPALVDILQRSVRERRSR